MTKTNKTSIIAIIPARMASSRFPGKPLEKIHGVPMVGHVYFRCKMSSLLDEVYVATCDQEIFDYVESIGGKAVMTKDTHERCTERTTEAVLKIEAATGNKADIVLMVQGDEPMITPEMIDQSIQPMLEEPSIQVVNLMAKMKTEAEFEDPNEVKVVVDAQNFALYFSREPVPSRKKFKGPVPMLKQVCVIPFRRDFLILFDELPPTNLEQIESVDMMRVLENGHRVKMIMTEVDSYSVDNTADLENVLKKMSSDPLMDRYLSGKL